MCGRFYIDDDMINEIERICKRIDNSFRHVGDVHPGNQSFMIKADADKELIAEACTWGIPNKYNKSLLINSRAETVHEKPTFASDFYHHRCVIPAKAYYEWNQEKQQYRFWSKDNSIPVLYLAGIYKLTEEGARFTIITTQADTVMQPVHNRMPLVIPERKLPMWMNEPLQATQLLKVENQIIMQKEQVKIQKEFQQETLLF